VRHRALVLIRNPNPQRITPNESSGSRPHSKPQPSTNYPQPSLFYLDSENLISHLHSHPKLSPKLSPQTLTPNSHPKSHSHSHPHSSPHSPPHSRCRFQPPCPPHRSPGCTSCTRTSRLVEPISSVLPRVVEWPSAYHASSLVESLDSESRPSRGIVSKPARDLRGEVQTMIALPTCRSHGGPSGPDRVFDFSTQTPISPICRTPLFPTSQN